MADPGHHHSDLKTEVTKIHKEAEHEHNVKEKHVRGITCMKYQQLDSDSLDVDACLLTCCSARSQQRS